MKKFVLFMVMFFATILLCACVASLDTIGKNINTYTIVIEYDDSQKTLHSKQKVDYVNNTEYTFDELAFHLYPNAFRENSIQKVVSLNSYSQAYPNGASYGGIEMTSVCDDISNTLQFKIDGYDENILFVTLPQKLFPDERVVLNFEYIVSLPNINHRFGYGENATNIANFYPIACVSSEGGFVTDPYNCNGDPFYSDSANYYVSITYDDSLTLACTGEKTATKNQNGLATTDIKAKVVRDFAMVLSGKFEVVSEVVEDTTVSYYYHNDENFEKSLQTSVSCLKTYSSLFGDYPYSTLSVVQTNFVYGGMEYPNLVYISDTLSSYKDYTNVIIHEIAHQWWYGVVGSNEYANPWQDEGLTDYSTALFYENNPSYEVNIEEIMENGVKTYHFYTQVYSAVYKSLDTSMDRALDEYTNENEYVYIAYVKGMLLFDSLRDLIGDKHFFESLQLYFKTYSYRNAQPYDMIWAFEKASNKNLESFFASWIEGKIIVLKA